MSLIETSLFGVRLSAGTVEDATAAIFERAGSGGGVVCVANVDMVTRAVDDKKLAALMQSAFAVVPDGVPLLWVLHSRGLKSAERIYGPTLMRDLCALAATEQVPVYFYGGTPHELAALKAALLTKHPNLLIAGAESPPLLPEEPPFDRTTAERISRSGARLVFVGLGCPKQEHWMAAHAPHLDATLVGVGQAFAQIAGLKRQAPAWMGRNGLEWLFRLVQEPRRLWRRYLLGNARFVAYLVREQFSRLR